MSHQSHEQSPTGVVKNYTQTALLSFIMMFCLFLTMSRCHGYYHPVHTTHHAEKAVDHSEAGHH